MSDLVDGLRGAAGKGFEHRCVLKPVSIAEIQWTSFLLAVAHHLQELIGHAERAVLADPPHLVRAEGDHRKRLR